jgi:hypothetical protein
MTMIELRVIIVIVVISVIAAILSLGISIYMLRRSNKTTAMTLKASHEYFKSFAEEVQGKFEKYDPLISKAYGIIGNMGVESKALAKGEELLTQDFMNNTELGVLLQGAGQLFPRFGEWAEENPDLALQLAPRILAFAKQAGIVPPGGALSSGDGIPSGKHPFGLREE